MITSVEVSNMDKIDALSLLRKEKLISVVRIDSNQTEKVIDAIIDGGVKFIEITLTMDNAFNILSNVAKKYKNTDVVIGAGTVIDIVSARLAISNGAEFIVAPTFNKDIAELCNLYRIPYIPGIHNPNDIQEALKSGCDVLKLFPASTLAPFVIKEFKGPFPQARFIISGKVNETNANEWLKKGADAVCLGSVLTNEEKNGLDKVTSKTSEFVSLVK